MPTISVRDNENNNAREREMQNFSGLEWKKTWKTN